MAKSDIKAELEEILVEVAKTRNLKNYKLNLHLDAQFGDGFVAHFYMADLIDEDSGETINVAIKKIPPNSGGLTPIFQQEAAFYTHIFPTLNSLQKGKISQPFNNIPELFCFEFGRRKRVSSYGKPKNQRVRFVRQKDRQHLEFILKIYGKFHALSFILRKSNRKRYQDMHNEYSDVFRLFVEFCSPQMEPVLAAAVEALEPASAVFEAAKDLPKNTKSVLLKEGAYDGKYGCSLHGDCWVNNMLFKYSEPGKLEDVKLVDFQMAREGSPVHDISYFIYSGASKVELDDLEHYLKIYHNSLSETIRQLGENPSEPFPYEALLQEWKDNALLGVIMGVYLWQIKLLPKEELGDDLKNPEINTKEGRTEYFKRIFAEVLKSQTFKERTTALLSHAYDIGVLTKEKTTANVF